MRDPWLCAAEKKCFTAPMDAPVDDEQTQAAGNNTRDEVQPPVTRENAAIAIDDGGNNVVVTNDDIAVLACDAAREANVDARSDRIFWPFHGLLGV